MKQIEVKKMSITKSKTNKQNLNVMQPLGALLMGFAFIDFATSWLGVNLTSFLGPVSAFTPMITGFIGVALFNAGKNE